MSAPEKKSYKFTYACTTPWGEFQAGDTARLTDAQAEALRGLIEPTAGDGKPAAPAPHKPAAPPHAPRPPDDGKHPIGKGDREQPPTAHARNQRGG